MRTTGSRQSQAGAVFANLALGAATLGGIAAVATECAKLPFRIGQSDALEPVIIQGKCRLTLPLSAGGDYVVENALQPTLTDLKELGLLDHGISDAPALTTDSLVAGPDMAGAASTTAASNTYAISISPVCIGMGSSATNCNNTNKALSSSVINIQPFVESVSIQNFMPLMWAAGPDTAISGPAHAANVVVQADRTSATCEFRSIQAGWTRPNAITKSWNYSTSSGNSSYSRGVDNLVVMRIGYDSAYWQLTRRDGALPQTANWDFNDKDLTNAGNLKAGSAILSGNVEVGGDLSVAGDQTIQGNQSATGNVSVDGISTFKGILNALSDLVVKGSTELQGKMTVAGTALFKDNVTLDKNLQVKGTTQLGGALTGTSANFNGTLTADSLVIGSTQIANDGTLLGSLAGWGVSTGSACHINLALAQSTDGKLQICRNAGWSPLVTSENIFVTTPGTGQTCSPEGAPGRLPDGTLAVCRNGNWESTSQGSVSEGGACSVDGALATGTASPNSKLIVLGCRSGHWTKDFFTKPQLAYGTEGHPCQVNDELALDGRGYPSLLICKGGKWQPPGTQLLSSMTLGTRCTLDGGLASDIQKTAYLFARWHLVEDHRASHLGRQLRDVEPCSHKRQWLKVVLYSCAST